MPMIILVIEDDDDILFAVQGMLENEGFTVKSARNGREALERIDQEGIPDLILLDMKMPVMNGWTFAEEFFRRYDRSAPIVVMTAAADAAKRAEEVHADGWLAKPFAIDALLATVKSHAPDA